MAYTIRSYRADDAEVLARIVATAIAEIGPRAYSAEQVAAWSALHPGAEGYRQRDAAGHVMFVAVDADDYPVAYTLVEPDGHLDHLYTHPQHLRRGLAALLLAQAEAYARASAIERLYTEASDLARPAFERVGYVMMKKRELTIAHQDRNVPIHNWAMEKLLR